MHALFGQISGQVPDELSVAFTWFVQLGALAHGLVVSRERHSLRLLHLKPVHCHLKNERQFKEVESSVWK